MDQKAQKLIKDTLSKHHACYVLITCQEPSEDGHMQVEMTYEGPGQLAELLLLQGAQNFLKEKDFEEEFDEYLC